MAGAKSKSDGVVYYFALFKAREAGGQELEHFALPCFDEKFVVERFEPVISSGIS